MLRAARRIVSVVLVLAAGAAQAQTKLYEHTYGGQGLWASDRGDDGSGFRTFDQFRIANAGVVTGALWFGTYLDIVDIAENPVAPDEASWELTFWSGGTPDVAGGPLATRALALGEVTRTYIGGAVFQGIPIPVYRYEASFAPWAFAGGAEYSLSVMARSTTYNPLWAWIPGSGGDAQSWQQQFPSTSLVSHTGDRAFALVGTTVPEPGSLALLATGLAGVAGVGARRRRR